MAVSLPKLSGKILNSEVCKGIPKYSRVKEVYFFSSLFSYPTPLLTAQTRVKRDEVCGD